MSRSRRNFGFLLALLSLCWLFTSPLSGADRPDFSGVWQLNEELSENPSDDISMGGGGKGGGRSGGGGRGGGGDRGGGGMGGGRAGGSQGGQDDMRQHMQSLQEGVRLLDINHQDPELTILYADDRERFLYTDGREIVDEIERGIFEASAKWKSNKRIVFRGETTNGAKLTETYELADNGRQLYVTTKIEGSGRMPSISFKRVYDPAVPVEGDALEQELSGI
jgi:hypothetical protein